MRCGKSKRPKPLFHTCRGSLGATGASRDLFSASCQLALRSVAHFNAHRGQLVPEAVRGREVADLSGGRAAVEQVLGAWREGGIRTRLGRLIEPETKHSIEVEQQRSSLRGRKILRGSHGM